VRRRLQRTTAMMLAALAFAAGPIGRPDGIVGGVPSVSAAAFSDVGGHWAADAVEWAAANGIVDGYPDGTFRPDGAVSEPEFLAMLLRAFPQTVAPEPAPGEPWYAGFYVVARAYGWPVAGDPDAPFDRGRVARIVAASQGVAGSEEEAIRYLLANGLAHGKTSPTVEGFAPRDRLTRAEAVTFIRRLTERGLYLQPAPTDGQPGAASADIRVFGYAIGDREQDVVAGLGEPARRDASLYGFDWYVYNRDDRRYGLIGVQSGRVVALFGIIDAWEAEGGIRFGSTYDEVRNVYGEPLEFIEKGNARYLFEYGEREALLYETEKVTRRFSSTAATATGRSRCWPWSAKSSSRCAVFTGSRASGCGRAWSWNRSNWPTHRARHTGCGRSPGTKAPRRSRGSTAATWRKTGISTMSHRTVGRWRTG